MTLAEMIAAAHALARTADRAGARFGTALTIVLREAERKLRGVVDTASKGKNTAILRGVAAQRARLEIRRVLEGAGYDHLMEQATNVPLDEMARAVAALRDADTAIETTNVLLLQTDALKALHLAELLGEGDDLSRALWAATVRGIFGSRSVPDILDDLAQILDKTEPQIRTLYDTSVSIFGRQVEALQAGDDPQTTFLYLGPDDEKTREFCQTHVGKVYTREKIDTMDNGQIQPVWLCAGGFNCRHSWLEVAKSSELATYANSNRQIPEYSRKAA